MKKYISILCLLAFVLSSCTVDANGRSKPDYGLITTGVAVAAIAAVLITASNDDSWDDDDYSCYRRRSHYSRRRACPY